LWPGGTTKAWGLEASRSFMALLILIRSLIGYAAPVGMVWQLERTLGVGTALDFFTAANVFVEMV
jgi:hypothetical protein